MKGNKGITLVALVITIVVMLILVAVTVAVVVNSDLIGSAEKAGNAYKDAADDLDHVSTDNTITNATYSTIANYLVQAGVTP